jgi:hypothetical protein
MLTFKVRIGNIVSHDAYSISAIPWKGITIHPRSEDPEETKLKIEKHARELRNALRSK